MALGADRSVLISERALAGSDTLATSRALALALKRENPDLIICGRNSADGDTGQVGPETAELMGLPHISHVKKLELSSDRKSVIAERITDEGTQTIECDLPVVVCVTEGVAPELYPNQDQMSRAEGITAEIISATDLSSDLGQFGVDGSPTSVSYTHLTLPTKA